MSNIPASQDQLLTCVSCGHKFWWHTWEQASLREKAVEAPQQCRSCRPVLRPRPSDVPEKKGNRK